VHHELSIQHFMLHAGANDGSNPTSTGAGSKWFVRGGTFKFRVSTDFAISQASVVGIDSSPDVKDHTIVISAPDAAKIYSRPMHVSTPITSVVSIKISKVTNAETVTSRWRNVAPDMKLMQLAAFGLARTTPTSTHLIRRPRIFHSCWMAKTPRSR
jgi:hypothetical protein